MEECEWRGLLLVVGCWLSVRVKSGSVQSRKKGELREREKSCAEAEVVNKQRSEDKRKGREHGR